MPRGRASSRRVPSGTRARSASSPSSSLAWAGPSDAHERQVAGPAGPGDLRGVRRTARAGRARPAGVAGSEAVHHDGGRQLGDRSFESISADFPGQMCYAMAATFIGLAILALIPVPPMDGGRILFTWGGQSYGWQHWREEFEDKWGIPIILGDSDHSCAVPVDTVDRLGDRPTDSRRFRHACRPRLSRRRVRVLSCWRCRRGRRSPSTSTTSRARSTCFSGSSPSTSSMSPRWLWRG